MKWFSGSIQDAIASAKHGQKIFLVFVEGKDETSKNMAMRMTENDISSPVDEHCVSVKLTTDSESFRQFSQIYPVIVVPSMFFIGNNGIPLEVIAGSEDSEGLVQKINKAIELHKTKLLESAVAAPSGVASTGPQERNHPDLTEGHLASTSQQQGALKQEEKSFTGSPQAPVEGMDDQATAEKLLKQKLERAELLMAERRRIKEKEEKEAEKQKELEQRRVSRELQKAREQMKEKEMADWAKQRQREKQEDRAARERVLAQIAQDNADRAARFQYSGSAPPRPTPPSSNTASQQPSVRQRTSPESSSSSSEVARIQFRLPDATAVSHEFPSSALLQDVIRHVEQVVKPGLPRFSLATSFPRRHFGKPDFSRTLRDLQLCPSTVLLVLPSSASDVQTHSSGGLWTLLWTLLSPLTLVWNFLSTFIFGSGRQQNTDAVASAPSNQQTEQQGSRPSGTRSEPKEKPSSSTRYRRDGNIHRLSNESSNDDEDGTWNGNSTQQM